MAAPVMSIHCRYNLTTMIKSSCRHGVDSDNLQWPTLAVNLESLRWFSIKRQRNNRSRRPIFMSPPPGDATFRLTRTRLPTCYFPMGRLDSIVSGVSLLLGMLPIVTHERPLLLRRFESYVRDVVAAALHNGDTLVEVSCQILCEYVVPECMMEAMRHWFDTEWVVAARAREEWETVIALRESEERAIRMSPASREFVESRLEKYGWEGGAATDGDDDSQQCVICMEEFESKSEIARMPCRHVFHETCITKWLQASNSCPLCRFEAPSATSQ